ncbi:DNA-processing protein DprA [Volucribacter amazonae]|uniref:DNA processing protein DprA n=1 Tax=Volucribacter amazonae TaxID=256731 RepID=A0A9X4PD35_9PAST|nr:DNA-processing protein DprA [Volucribacter amazonae]MDG6895176.1 DNA processing protein DprA [Volucribacter amazonae]
MQNQELAVLLRLLQIPQLNVSTIIRLLQQVTLADLLNYDRTAFQQIGWHSTQIQAWFHPKMQYIEPALQWQQQQPDQHIIHLLQADYPYLLRQIHSAPPILFVKGNLACLPQPQIAIVGSRHCSSYGEYWTKYFASELCTSGFIITSGLALGIDGFAHQAVIAQQGQTIAVLGSGLDHIYPTKHQQLAQQIIANQGALISEFLPQQPPVAKNFPRRNRIISGLSLATLVIEANEHSGSLITARYALEQNRDIFALPSHIQSQFSQGCHKLIKQGAMLVENVADIIENLSHYTQNYVAATITNPPLQTPPKTEPAISPEYPELFAHIPHTGISLDQLAEQLNLAVEELLIQLLALQLQGLISEQDGLYQRL